MKTGKTSKKNVRTRSKDRRMYAGHVPHTQGCGVHSDKRSKRKQTRQAKNAQAMKEQ